MIAALLLCLAQGAAPAALPAAPEWFERWSDELELDLARNVLQEGRALVEPGEALASDGRACALVARALFDGGDTEAARALLERPSIGLEHADFVALERARQHIELDELEPALKLLGQDPRQPAAEAVKAPAPPAQHELAASWFLVGQAFARAGQGARAASYLEHFVKVAPLDASTPRAWHLLSQEAFARGDAARGTQALERAEQIARWRAFLRVRKLQVREQPDEPLPRLGLALVYMEAQQFEPARAVLEELTRRRPSYADGWYHLAECQRKLGERQLADRKQKVVPAQAFLSAEASYTRALELDQKLDLARYNRAIIYLLTQRAALAAPELQSLVEGKSADDPKLLGAHLALARCLRDLGQEQAAQARHARYVALGGKEPLTP